VYKTRIFVKKILLSVLLLLCSAALFAQETSSLRSHWVKPQKSVIKADSLPIVPGSLQLLDKNKKPWLKNNYEVNYTASEIRFIQFPKDSLFLRYRVFEQRFSDTFSLHQKPLENNRVKPNRISSATDENKSRRNNASQLRTNGSISRGLTLGTNNNAALNSEMNLQLSGEPMPGIEINAALSDDNLPLQADGTTQHIKEFDRVFIEVKSKKSKLTAGDIRSKSTEGLFLNADRKVQGLNYALKHESNGQSELTLAVSKGKYRRMKFTGREGDQGPYRLSGNNNEYFIIVLADSERILVNGETLQRGEDYDYTINYNTAELSFTSNFPITKNSRIIAEFEYSDRNYTRFLTGGQTKINNKKGDFFVNFLSEKDAKNQSFTQELSDEQKDILRMAGDNPQAAVVPSETRIDSLDKNRITYIKKDSLVNGTLFESVYEYSPNPEAGEYYVNFSYIGSKQANYIRKPEAINGKVFEWIAPKEGVPQGSYAPVKQLISPKSKLMVSAGGSINIGEKTLFNVETAVSNTDENLFSELDRADDFGYALKAELLSTTDSSENGCLKLRSRYLHTGKNFSPFENFRSAELERDYNLSELSPKVSTHLAGMEAQASRGKTFKASLSGDFLAVGSDYQAGKGKLNIEYKGQAFSTGHRYDLLLTKDSLEQTQFMTYSSFLEGTFKSIQPGIKNEGERNIFLNPAKSFLKSKSYRFNEFTVYAKAPEGSELPYYIAYSNREDFYPKNESLDFGLESHTAKININPLNNDFHRLSINTNYRAVYGKDSLTSELELQKNHSGNFNYHLNSNRQALSLVLFAEHKAGSRMKQDFSYLEVAAGQGAFSWQDFNENGLQELEEFMTAKFPDEAKYIRIQLPTDEYQKVYEQKAELSFSLNPARFWTEKTNFVQNGISRFSNRLTIQSQRAFDTEEKPFTYAIADSLLFEQSMNFQNLVSYKNQSGNFLLNYRYVNTKNKRLLINGTNQQANEYQELKSVYRIQNFGIIPSYSVGIQSRYNEFPKSGNYEISYTKAQLELQYAGLKNQESRLIFSLDNKKNRLFSESLISYRADLKYLATKLGKNTLSGELSYIHNNFEGNTRSPAAYEMMQGLKDGNNVSWSISIQTEITEYLQLNLMYSGRKSDEAESIHTGNLSIRALF
jgi:hypothetical protein